MGRAKTDNQIWDEINRLRRLKPQVIRYSLFNDDNHAAIDAEVEVLAKKLTVEQVQDKHAEATGAIFDAAYEAAKWLAGDSDMKRLSDEWQALCRIKRRKT